ncbi:hypothetical protein FO519_007774 [Halicephalobus sp. NKZ332]|nr:hypothetical protein FO519_007774 [Halicephalobus sp. NKZ332]
MKMYKRDYYDDESTETEQIGVGFVPPEEAGWDNDDEFEEEYVDQFAMEFYKELPRFEPWYFITGTAFCRIVQALTAIISFGLVTWVNALSTPTYIVQATLLTAFGGSTFFLILYSSNLVRSTRINWIFHELIYTGLACYMVLLSLLIMSYNAVRHKYTPWILSVFFLFFCLIGFIADFGSLLKLHRRNPDLPNSDTKRMRDNLSNTEVESF